MINAAAIGAIMSAETMPSAEAHCLRHSEQSGDVIKLSLYERHRRSIGSLGIERRPLTPQVFDRRHGQQQVLGGFLRSLAAREGEGHLELPLAQAAQWIRGQVGRGDTARL